jgi:hypothetical protein
LGAQIEHISAGFLTAMRTEIRLKRKYLLAMPLRSMAKETSFSVVTSCPKTVRSTARIIGDTVSASTCATAMHYLARAQLSRLSASAYHRQQSVEIIHEDVVTGGQELLGLVRAEAGLLGIHEVRERFLEVNLGHFPDARGRENGGRSGKHLPVRETNRSLYLNNG